LGQNSHNPLSILQHDLRQLAQSFGNAQKIVMLRAKNQALLQMQDVPSAINVMQYYSTVQPSVRGRNVYLQFSSHQELTTIDQPGQPRRVPVEQVQLSFAAAWQARLLLACLPFGGFSILGFLSLLGSAAIFQAGDSDNPAASRNFLILGLQNILSSLSISRKYIMRLPIRHLKGGIESDNCVTVSFSYDIEELVTPSSCSSSSLHF
jgi:hypothetical protein